MEFAFLNNAGPFNVKNAEDSRSKPGREFKLVLHR